MLVGKSTPIHIHPKAGIHLSKNTAAEQYELISVSALGNAERNPMKPGKYAAKRIFAGEKAQITEIAFDADVELKEHVARTPIIVSVIEGKIEFTVEGRNYPLAVGGCIFVEANVLHAVYARIPARITVTFLSA